MDNEKISIDRRTFLKSTGVSGASLAISWGLASSILVAGCAKGSPTSSENTAEDATEKFLTISEIYAKGLENIENVEAFGGYRVYPPNTRQGLPVKINRRYLSSLFVETKYIDPVEVDTSVTLFGVKLRTPVYCACASSDPNLGDTAFKEFVKAIANVGSMYMMGGNTSSDQLKIAVEAGAPVVKIVKPHLDMENIYAQVREAETRGCVAVGIDIDHFYGVQGPDGSVFRAEVYSPRTMKEFSQLISQTKLPFIIKGVLSLADAEKAAQVGASAIVVSTHGCGSLRCAVPSMIALPKIAEKLRDKITILVDSGFETGNDVFKALAFGANAVGFGYTFLLAWCADGANGVELLIKYLTAELHRTMASTGCSNPAAIDPSIIVSLPNLIP